MSKIRITLLSVVLVLVITGAVFFAATALPAMAAQPAASCPVPAVSSTISASSLTTQELWNILNGRYERRVNAPY